ncbi:reverse transcriptase domain-containing protein [Tanacetum coccineum]
MKEGVFLGYKVNSDGLMVCPDKVEAVISLPSPKCLKDMQRLNRKLASLNRIPLMVGYKRKEELIIYLAAAKEAISAILMTERDRKQIPIYFVSQALRVERPKDNSEDTLMVDAKELPGPWILFTDGSSCTDGSGAGLILTDPEGKEFTYALSKQVLVEELKEKSISAAEVLVVVEEEGDTWMTPIFKYLTDGTLLGKGKSKSRYTDRSWQKALRIGYYWPTMHEDARKLIQACQDCQVHKPVPRNP